MAKISIAKLAANRENLKKQLQESKRKIQIHEEKLAKLIGDIAIQFNLDKLSEDMLKKAFEKIAKENKLL